MFRSVLASLGLAAALITPVSAQEAPTETSEWRLVIHGGAGVILRENLSEEQEAAYRAGLEVALERGAAVLREGGSAVDAVQAAVIPMENNPLFNAGFGAVFTAAAEHELDASIMDGRDRNAGSVAGVRYTKNPILAARAVMDQSEHVMFAGKGADAFAAQVGLELVNNDFFDTDRRRRSLEKVLKSRERTDADRHGTVGAIAVDAEGNLAAATTTGGMTAKAAGRVGDTPLIGAATYAQNGVCAVSSTGHGEYFIRVAVAKTICAEMELAGASAKDAAQSALDQVAELGGDGGVIVMDADGHYEYVFNSAGMYRGMIDPNGFETAIFEAE
ncbi:MAG: isoaspartyl peptidase/L-asparaginase [Henriciella sp.]|nr:isoaspartyl peptidase/L-asparaginase [Henriciella sp.]